MAHTEEGTSSEEPRRLLRRVREGDAGQEEAARGLKKVAESRPEELKGLGAELLREAMRTEDLRVRWNLMVALGKLALANGLARRERAGAVDWMFERLGDASPFTRTFALQALWELSGEDAALRRRVLRVVREFAESGTAAMRARARRLLRESGADRK